MTEMHDPESRRVSRFKLRTLTWQKRRLITAPPLGKYRYSEWLLSIVHLTWKFNNYLFTFQLLWPLTLHAKPKALGGWGGNHCSSPKVLVHRLEEEFVVWLVQDLLKIQQSNVFGRYGYLHQIRRLLFVDVINDFSFRHFFSCFPPTNLDVSDRKILLSRGKTLTGVGTLASGGASGAANLTAPRVFSPT